MFEMSADGRKTERRFGVSFKNWRILTRPFLGTYTGLGGHVLCPKFLSKLWAL